MFRAQQRVRQALFDEIAGSSWRPRSPIEAPDAPQAR
jgi:hypothetical protein